MAGRSSNAQSTAYAVQGLLAVGAARGAVGPRAPLSRAHAAPRRQHLLLGDELADAGVGDGAGARGARTRALADRPGGARRARAAPPGGPAGTPDRGRARVHAEGESPKPRAEEAKSAGNRSSTPEPPPRGSARREDPRTRRARSQAAGNLASTLRLDPRGRRRGHLALGRRGGGRCRARAALSCCGGACAGRGRRRASRRAPGRSAGPSRVPAASAPPRRCFASLPIT